MDRCDRNDEVGAIAAIKGHLMKIPPIPLTAAQIHALWNPWPSVPFPMQYTESALIQLEGAGYLESVEMSTDRLWYRT